MQSCDRNLNCGFNGTLSYHLWKTTTTTTTMKNTLYYFLMQKLKNIITYAMRTNKTKKRIFPKMEMMIIVYMTQIPDFFFSLII